MNSNEAYPYTSSTFKTSTTTLSNFSVKLLYFNTTSSSSIDDKNDVIAFKDATFISINGSSKEDLNSSMKSYEF